MEEKARGLAGETTSGGEGEVGGDQEVGDVVRVNVAGDCMVVAGGAGVLHDGAVVGCEPERAKDSGSYVMVGGAQVVDGEQGFCDGLNLGKVKGRRGGVADGDDGAGVKGGVRDEIVVRGGRILGGAERASVDERSLKDASGTFFLHLVGRRRQDLRDTTWAAPCNDVVGAASGPKQLRVGWRYVNFYAIVQRECLGGSVFVQTFLRCLGHEGFVRRSKGVESLDGGAQRVNEGRR